MPALISKGALQMLPMLFSVLMVSHASACELAQSRIVFPNLGTHVAWYCKATEAEKQKALDAVLKHSCIPQKLKDWGKPPLSTEVNDVIPYFFTKPDAEKAGPILDVRVTLEQSLESIGEKRTGYRVLATGRKIFAALPPQGNPAPGTARAQPIVLDVQFDLGAPTAYSRSCPATGCFERFGGLCE